MSPNQWEVGRALLELAAGSVRGTETMWHEMWRETCRRGVGLRRPGAPSSVSVKRPS